jgi:hypothetical protein
MHEKREAIHDEVLNQNVPYVEISRKYFPDKQPKAISKTLTQHFRQHFNVEREVAALQVSQTTPGLLSTHKGIPMLASEERVYSEYVRKRLSSTATLEEALRNLMEKANFMEDEWIAIHQVTKCTVCGRDDNKDTLGKMLAIFKELRETHKVLMTIRNPVEVFKKFFDQTFILFVDKMMELYMETLREKGKMINAAINQYLRNEISAALLSRRVAELENMGTPELERQMREHFKKILQSVRKEMDTIL